MKKKLVVGLLSLSMALALLVGCGSSYGDRGMAESNVEETQTVVETAIESTIETTEASTIEETSIVDETIKESGVIESSETSKETTTSPATSEVVASTPSSAVASDTNTPISETPVVKSQVESVAETVQETTSTTTTFSSYSADECVSIIKSTLISAGIQWYPDTDLYKEFPEFGLDGGMGWGIDYVDMSDPYSYVQNAIVTFKHNRWEYFYFEILGVSDGEMELKFYRG
jgi:hypothetical protein